MRQDTKIIQSKTGVKVLCVLIYIAGIVLLSVHLPFNIPERYKIYIVPGYVVFGLLWLADVFFTRIELHSDRIKIVSDFKTRTIPRAEVAGVTWEKGCGTSLKLCDDKWVKLPGVSGNAQGLANTIRAWINRTMPKS